MRTIILISLLAAAMAAPQPTFVRPINADCITVPSSVGVDGSLFPSEYTLQGDQTTAFPNYTEVKSASGFSVEYHDQYKVVHNSIANETYVLSQCDLARPTAFDFPSGTKFFTVPLTSVSVPETVPYAFLELLGVDDRVQSVSPYETSACGQQLLACPDHTAPDFFQLGNTSMLQSTVGPSIDSILSSSAEPYEKAISFNGPQEPGVLKNVEWIKFLGLFFNREKYAGDIYNAIVQEYDATKAEAAAANVKSDEYDTPVVAFIENYDYEGDEAFVLSFAPYKEQLVTDAGGKMLDMQEISKVEGVRPTSYSNTSLEFSWTGNDTRFATKADAQAAFLNVLQAVDVVVDDTYTPTPAEYNFDSFKEQFGLNSTSATNGLDLPWLTNRRVFRTDGLISANNGSDWFEGAYVRPDKVLADFVRVVDSARNFTTVLQPKNFSWVRTIDEEPRELTAANCGRMQEGCNDEPKPICPFVSVCPDGTTTLLRDTNTAQCSYEDCDTNALITAANTAQMAAPAVILLTVLIVFVEALINFC